MKLLNEGVAWVNLDVPVRPGLDQWIWIQLTVTEDGELFAKVWVDGEKEPDKLIAQKFSLDAGIEIMLSLNSCPAIVKNQNTRGRTTWKK